MYIYLSEWNKINIVNNIFTCTYVSTQMFHSMEVHFDDYDYIKKWRIKLFNYTLPVLLILKDHIESFVALITLYKYRWIEIHR